ncbi:hypothetical protein [uncultured Methanobrevibacter sp.]|uniref:hypothetical protein n=1 Tax=uncultured Methanobrevibacter sp. TaxID=253161 RepID=UPI0026E01459|nr:hypothetical protein [uncultured Methanobrevibacter sp.]
MSIKDDFNSWSKGKKVAAIGGICCIGIIIIFLISSVITPDANTANDDFNGKDARLENVSISSSYGFFSVDGKIMFKYDESYAELSADVNLKDGSKIAEPIVKNWNDVNKDQWYTFDGSLLSTSGNDYSLDDISSVDFKYNDEVIYTWKNQ